MKYCPNDACPWVLEHRSRSTFEDHVASCCDCGTALVTGEPSAPPVAREDRPLELVTVAAFSSGAAAQLALERLEAEGIPAMIVDGRRVTPGAVAALQVRADELDAAHEVLGTVAELSPGGADEDAAPAEPEPQLATESCPSCGGTEFEIRTGAGGGLLTALFGKKKAGAANSSSWRKVCQNCGAEQEYE